MNRSASLKLLQENFSFRHVENKNNFRFTTVIFEDEESARKAHKMLGLTNTGITSEDDGTFTFQLIS